MSSEVEGKKSKLLAQKCQGFSRIGEFHLIRLPLENLLFKSVYCFNLLSNYVNQKWQDEKQKNFKEIR